MLKALETYMRFEAILRDWSLPTEKNRGWGGHLWPCSSCWCYQGEHDLFIALERLTKAFRELGIDPQHFLRVSGRPGGSCNNARSVMAYDVDRAVLYPIRFGEDRCYEINGLRRDVAELLGEDAQDLPSTSQV